MEINFVNLSDKFGYKYPFASFPVSNIDDIQFTDVSCTFALVTLEDKKVLTKHIVGNIGSALHLPTKLRKLVENLNPTHLLLYHAYADTFIINHRLKDFEFLTTIENF